MHITVDNLTVREAAGALRRILIPGAAPQVFRTVADAWRAQLSPGAEVQSADEMSKPTPATLAFRQLSGDCFSGECRIRWLTDNAVDVCATHPSVLYPFFTLVSEEWADTPLSSIGGGVTYRPALPWLRNLNDFLVGSLRTARGFDREVFVRHLARCGFTHLTVNGLGTNRPFETSPPGDVYHWFYDYSPDLDQFVDSDLLRGYYPPDYLRTNLEALRANVLLARKYGLIPGLHINSPRSMPEEFWNRYGYLRGARVDHPRETLRPRYALALAHPVVQNHYRQMMRKLLQEIPDLGFIHVWTNDSGAGFEFVSSLYAGRNGGPYLLREWKSDDAIARVAAANVVRYYRLLTEECRRVNPEFHLVCDLGPFFAERKYIVPELGNGMDAGDFAFFEEQSGSPARAAIEETGALVHRKLDLCDNNVLGVPAPHLVYERLNGARESGACAVLANIAPPSLVPFDINGEVVRAFQCGRAAHLEPFLRGMATAWAGEKHAGVLLKVWSLADGAVRSYPPEIPMSTFGFPWFRLWVRPFVPNIDAIAEEERAYYEEFLLATFNNPARVDLNNDMMWNFLTVQQAGELKQRVDAAVIAPLDRAIDLLPARDESVVDTPPVLIDQRDRLIAARCYYMTMRNTVAWIESVHGYLEATTIEEKRNSRRLCGEMVNAELTNARTLLALWKVSNVHFMPISSAGESLHIYGENFGTLLERKIALMERHANDEPYIDREYMWRMRN